MSESYGGDTSGLDIALCLHRHASVSPGSGHVVSMALASPENVPLLAERMEDADDGSERLKSRLQRADH